MSGRDNVIELIISAVNQTAPGFSGARQNLSQFVGYAKEASAAIGVALSFKQIVDATIEAQDALAQLGVAYRNSGEAARRSKQDIIDYADAQMKATTFGDEALVRAQTVLLRYGRVSGDTFSRARRDIEDVASALHIDLETAATSVGRALQSPANGMLALRALGVQFTTAQRELIQSLTETNQTAKAQDVILSALEDSYSGAAEAARGTLGGALKSLKNEFGELFETTEGAASSAANSINDITAAVSDPDFKRNIQEITGTLLSWAAEFAKIVAGAVSGWGMLYDLLNKSANDLFSGKTPFDEMLDKQADIADKLTRAIEARDRLQRTGSTGTGSIASLRDLNKEVDDLRSQMADVQHQIQNASQAPGTGRVGENWMRGGPIGSRQRSLGGVNFVPQEQLDQQAEDAAFAARQPISEVVITAKKNELLGLKKLLKDFDDDTQLSEEKILQQYRDTIDKLDELFRNGKISGEEFAQRLAQAQVKYDEAVTIDPVRITQQKTFNAYLTEQEKHIKEFTDTVNEALKNAASQGEISGKAILRYLIAAFESKLLYAAIDKFTSYLAKSIKSAASSSSSSSGSSGFFGSLIGAVFGAASGSNSTMGLTVVGENGPEVVGSGNRVWNAQQLRGALGGGSGGGSVTINEGDIVVQGNADDRILALMQAQKLEERKRTLREVSALLYQNGYGSLR